VGVQQPVQPGISRRASAKRFTLCEQVPVEIDVRFVAPAAPGEAERVQAMQQYATDARARIPSADPLLEQTQLDGRTKKPFDSMDSARNYQRAIETGPRSDRDIDRQFLSIRSAGADRIRVPLATQAGRCVADPAPRREVV
jgi:hypothetical protein